MRTAVEQVNSRLDVSFGFKEHFIRSSRQDEVTMFSGAVRDIGHGAGENKREPESSDAEPCKERLKPIK